MNGLTVKYGSVVLPLCLYAAGADAVDEALSCHVNDKRQPAVLGQAPTGARRMDAHTLRVNWQSGSTLFKDAPPYDKPLSGVLWRYCGYGRASGFHLIQKIDKGLSSGVLLNERSGQMLEGGHRVIFTLNNSRYFAARQARGSQGEQWQLYDSAGHLLWLGRSRISGAQAGALAATLRDPRWNAFGTLQATVSCANTDKVTPPKPLTVTLEFTGGRYRWLPDIACR